MRVHRLLPSALAFATAITVVTALSAAPDARPPRIVSAAMLDADRDGRADGLRLTYSERVRHAADRDGRYPFTVAGYRIRSVGSARGKTLLLALVERAQADDTARPAIRYRRAGKVAVIDPAGNLAAAQRFARVVPHGNRPTGNPGPTGNPDPNPQPLPLTDRDGDGALDGQDCGPDNPNIRPGAPDRPDLAFVDSNCDGIDGTERDAIFVSPDGKNTNPGTKAAPKREINAAVSAAVGKNKYVLAAAGTYDRVIAASGVGIYGGYRPTDWSRRTNLVTFVAGATEAVYAENAVGVELELLTVLGTTDQIKVAPGVSFYGIRAVNGSDLVLRRVSIGARNGQAGSNGSSGTPGVPGEDGAPGGNGQCGGATRGVGGIGGGSAAGLPGGGGGRGGHDTGGITGRGAAGELGAGDTPGGVGGNAGDPGRDGAPGSNGNGGAGGQNGAGAPSSIAGVARAWLGQDGADGTAGTPGHGGGGGGGGGGQVCIFCNNGSGNGGGGGGGGGGAGSGGGRGTAGGGSFGIYLHDSSVTVSDASSIKPGDGAVGGAGGNGGQGAYGGSGGLGATYCKSEIGEGGTGGQGGPGGHGGGGGGGEGGPSVGIFRAGTSVATLSADTTVTTGRAGEAGAGGVGSEQPAGSGAPGISLPVYPAP